MVTYVTLYRYTQQGINNIQGAPKRIAAARKKAKAAGVRIADGTYYAVSE